MSHLLMKEIDGVRWIVFDWAEKLNALLPDDIINGRKLVEEACEKNNAIVLSGRGSKSFSTGIYVNTFLKFNPIEARNFIEYLSLFIKALRQAPIPVICAIDGYCLGAAMELAAAADIRIATLQSSFGMPEIKLGIPSVLEAALLQQYVGLGKAKEMILTGDLYDAKEMYRCGFINTLVDKEELRTIVGEMISRVTHDKTVIASQKILFNVWQNTSLDQAVEASVNEFALLFADEVAMERVRKYANSL